ncbi:CRAL-TRIO domain-containing protein [Mycena belliarum]|uniref:CRAL-TRIO domain-containing protein n=1 Tax=Mycena belliarum TaxID=1033014 RepID=A0AAD6XQG3_9AGAR|nr:CRAL-TRIO domain-containing protein [Mycena belliae]
MDLLLKANFEKLLEQYTENLDAVRNLQGTLIEDILPSVTDELELDAESVRWAAEWLDDTYSLFQILRRNKFTRSFAMESVRKTLVWRFSHLWPPDAPLRMPLVHCLHPPVVDPFGRPILVVKIVSFNDSSDAFKPLILRGLERLRLHLRRLNRESDSPAPILQYVILIDLANLSTQSLNIDLVTWTMREAIPQFPGLLAAAFMINYSWAHAGLWSIAKRVLPARAQSRVFFPTQDELRAYFSPGMLPADYGGTLASLTELHDPLWNDSGEQRSRSVSVSAPSIVVASVPLAATPLPATSLLNPFFGYPVSSMGGAPALHHGRRRKRDLARTLLILTWRRWRSHIMVCVWISVFVLTARGRRAWFRSSAGGRSLWQALCSTPPL